jgi:hypothetical protein
LWEIGPAHNSVYNVYSSGILNYHNECPTLLVSCLSINLNIPVAASRDARPCRRCFGPYGSARSVTLAPLPSAWFASERGEGSMTSLYSTLRMTRQLPVHTLYFHFSFADGKTVSKGGCSWT